MRPNQYSPTIVAIHGILNRLTQPQWPWQFAAFVDAVGVAAHIETEHYPAGPFPRLNKFWTNPRVAKALHRRILLRREALGPTPIHIVAHSNGDAIANNLIKRLAKAKIEVDTLVSIGSAVDSDIQKSGRDNNRCVGRYIAYCSASDKMIRHLETIPGGYGSLGSRGYRLRGEQVGEQLDGYEINRQRPFADFATRWFRDFSHSQYFDAQWRDHTFTSVLRDMGFEPHPLIP